MYRAFLQFSPVTWDDDGSVSQGKELELEIPSLYQEVRCGTDAMPWSNINFVRVGSSIPQPFDLDISRPWTSSLSA